MLFWGLRTMSHAPLNLSTRLSSSLLQGVDELGAGVASHAVSARWGASPESCCSRSASCFLSHVAQKLGPSGDRWCVRLRTDCTHSHCFQLREYRSCIHIQSLLMEGVLCCSSSNHVICPTSSCTEDCGPGYLLHKGQMESFARLFWGLFFYSYYPLKSRWGFLQSISCTEFSLQDTRNQCSPRRSSESLCVAGGMLLQQDHVAKNLGFHSKVKLRIEENIHKIHSFLMKTLNTQTFVFSLLCPAYCLL